jgi:hypothetical protein
MKLLAFTFIRDLHFEILVYWPIDTSCANYLRTFAPPILCRRSSLSQDLFLLSRSVPNILFNLSRLLLSGLLRLCLLFWIWIGLRRMSGGRIAVVVSHFRMLQTQRDIISRYLRFVWMLMVYMSVLNCTMGIFDSLSNRYRSLGDIEVVSVQWFVHSENIPLSEDTWEPPTAHTHSQRLIMRAEHVQSKATLLSVSQRAYAVQTHR